MSRLFSKNLVAVKVDHVIMNMQKVIPAIVCRLKKRDPTARKQKGSRE